MKKKLCDKVPEFDNATAMVFIESELGAPWYDIYEELQGPVAAASLGQVYKGRLKGTGEEVAVKVQRPAVLETITVSRAPARAPARTATTAEPPD